MGLQLRREQEAALSMSSNVSMLTHLISLREVLVMVRQRCRGHVGGVHAGDAVLVSCEAKKALVAMGILNCGTVYSQHQLNSVLADPKATCLLFALESFTPLSDEELKTRHGKQPIGSG